MCISNIYDWKKLNAITYIWQGPKYATDSVWFQSEGSRE